MIEKDDLINIYKSKFRKKSKYKIEDFMDLENLKNISSYGTGYKAINKRNQNIDEDLRALEIPSFMENEYILTKSKIICAQYIYLDLYIIIQKYNLKKIDFNEFKTEVYSYFGKDKRELPSNSKNTTFLMSKKQSIELPRDKALYPTLDSLRKELGLIILEVPNHFKRDETFKFLRDIRKLLNELGIKKLKTNFRIRKILKLKNNGMFIVNANTLVIDPRSPEKVIHEIGHYVYENRLGFNWNGRRVYKNRFEGLIKKNRGIEKIDISKYEDYSQKSEVFAYWFEREFS